MRVAVVCPYDLDIPGGVQDQTTRLARDRGRAVQHLAQHAERERIARPAHQVQRKQRRSTHGVDVAQRIGAGDGAPGKGVVDDGREEVGCGHQGAIVGYAKYGGIVSRCSLNEDARVLDHWQVTQNLRQFGSAELTRSTCAVSQGGEPNLRALVGVFVHVGMVILWCGPTTRPAVRSGRVPPGP